MIEIEGVLNINKKYKRPKFRLDIVRLKLLDLYKYYIFLFLL